MTRYWYHADQRDTQRAKIARDWEGAVRDVLASSMLTGRGQRYASYGNSPGALSLCPDHGGLRTVRSTRRCWPTRGAGPSPLPEGLVSGCDPIWRALSRVERTLRIPARRA